MSLPGVRPAPPAGSGFPQPTLRHPLRQIGDRRFDFSRQVAVMAVVNRTPDSFYDRGATFALESAVQAALAAVAAGADWVDIGGVPFSPGPELPVEEECARVLPVVQALRAASDCVISVDTFQPEVARRGIAAGATVVNDTTGLHHPELAEVVADSDATLVITHSLASPRTQYPRPHYDDVMTEVADFLLRRVDLAISLGVPEERIVIDPGHDLNKNTLQSLEITRRLGELTALGHPVLVAVSNKDFIGESINAQREERVEGSLAAMVACILAGARIVRMHNVTQSVASVRMTEAILGLRAPHHLKHNLGEFNVHD
ncbi:dihydropteroate synthase [Microterricola viridarii]|uniref:Dihydropteroate synthase n=1 Tax=Microterricola viridarii TaxID=412690 RepID=A0A1H1YJA0_9MICO|nr:dihydropteroate synthase [Microterricola viridarii]SDT21527.1 Dihydropteroate synthase [Microterricola viridarii]